jgi:hypothetical protein
MTSYAIGTDGSLPGVERKVAKLTTHVHLAVRNEISPCLVRLHKVCVTKPDAREPELRNRLDICNLSFRFI